MLQASPWVLGLAAEARLKELEPICSDAGLAMASADTTDEALLQVEDGKSSGAFLACVICALGRGHKDACWPLLHLLRQRGGDRRTFIIVLSLTAARSPRTRLDCFVAGANMVTHSLSAVRQALELITEGLQSSGDYACPVCGLEGLTENGLHTHGPLYHSMQPNLDATECPICGERCGRRSPYEVHLNNCHGPPEKREPPPAPFAAFSWGVCRRRKDGKFLLVNEPAGISRGLPRYWLPAGRVDIGESLAEAACRECLEEAGVRVRAVGVLRFMVDSRRTPRVVFLTEPEDEDAEPKGVPDWESVGALWIDVRDLKELEVDDYRAPDPLLLYPKVASGEYQVHSLDTEPYRNLEEMIRSLTAGNRVSLKDQERIWNDLLTVYPESAFDFK